MPDTPTLTAAQEQAIRDWARWAGGLDTLADLVAGWLAEARAEGKPCRCAWCCQSTAPEKRGETHRQTCHPRQATP